MADKPKYYKAKEGFVTMYDGEQVSVPAGEIVSAGHPILKRREDHFVPVESFGRFDSDGVEQATKAPGEKRGKPARKRRSSRASGATGKARPVAAAEPAKPFGLTTKDVEPGSSRSEAPE
jgi:hypothetical protein